MVSPWPTAATRAMPADCTTSAAGAGPDVLLDHIPAGPAREELARLVAIGRRFDTRRPRGRGFLARHLAALVAGIAGPVSFERLLEELELEAARRNLRGAEASPIEKVDRCWELVTYHDPKRGRRQIPFATLRNKLTACKKCIGGHFPISAKP